MPTSIFKILYSLWFHIINVSKRHFIVEVNTFIISCEKASIKKSIVKDSKWNCCGKACILKDAHKVIIHKLRGEQFSWKSNWDLGWFWASWQYQKNIWADYEQLLRSFFFCFQRQKSYSIFKNYLSVRAKKLHKMKLKND